MRIWVGVGGGKEVLGLGNQAAGRFEILVLAFHCWMRIRVGRGKSETKMGKWEEKGKKRSYSKKEA